MITNARFATPEHDAVNFDFNGVASSAPLYAVADLLAAHGAEIAAYTPPAPTADDVRREAQRRIIALMGARDLPSCLVKQLNANMRAVELTFKRASGGTLTSEEEAEAVFLQSMAAQIKDIRAASNVLEGAPPDDFADDFYWP